MSTLDFSWYQDLTIELLRKELKVRYKRLALGYLWSLGNPLAYAALYYVVFSKVLKIQVENYPLFLISGLFPWQWVTNGTLSAATTFYMNAPLIKKTAFPRFLIPLVITFQDGIHFLASLPVVFCFMLLYHVPLQLSMIPSAIILFILQGILLYSLHLIIATLTVFLRDLERLLQIAMTFLFYLTPVLYAVEQIPTEFRHLLIWHPIAPLILNWRHLFLGQPLNLSYLGSSMLYCILFSILSSWIYRRLSWKFAEVL